MREVLLEIHPLLTLLVLVVVTASTIISVRLLRVAKRTLRLSERRMQYLTEERERLALLRKQNELLQETLEQEREGRLATQQRIGLLENVQQSESDGQAAASLGNLQ